MNDMFQASKFDSDISRWDVRNVRTMIGMFSYSNFSGDISSWQPIMARNFYNFCNDSPLEQHPEKQPKFYK